jgi:hypothetical protein
MVLLMSKLTADDIAYEMKSGNTTLRGLLDLDRSIPQSEVEAALDAAINAGLVARATTPGEYRFIRLSPEHAKHLKTVARGFRKMVTGR